jgi:hypothetical protein
MRALALALIAAGLASCTTAPPQPSAREARNQQQLQAMLVGKTAGGPITCLPSYNQNDMQVIDGRTVAFRLGQRTLYLMHLSPGCELLGSGHYALLTRESGGMGTCRGDIARVFDTSSRMTVGSCGIAEIVPYTTR